MHIAEDPSPPPGHPLPLQIQSLSAPKAIPSTSSNHVALASVYLYFLLNSVAGTSVFHVKLDVVLHF